MAQRITITPEQALEHLDGVAGKYQGTRDDHNLLSASISLLQQVVAQWRKLSEEKIAEEEEVREPPVEVPPTPETQ
jgi:hypothetical protein